MSLHIIMDGGGATCVVVNGKPYKARENHPEVAEEIIDEFEERRWPTRFRYADNPHKIRWEYLSQGAKEVLKDATMTRCGDRLYYGWEE